MELRHLRYFVAVAEMENVSRAALKLHVSQPAFSRQIRDLEDEIGFSLLERTAKSVRLTDAGRAFLDKLLPLNRHLLLVSGRASFEILQKALAAGVPIVAAVSAPSTLAVDFARESNQTLIGFLRPPTLNIYSHIERVILEGRHRA